MMNGQGTQPTQPSVESGGATNIGHLQWIQGELNRHTQELATVKASTEAMREKIELLTSSDAGRKIQEAVTGQNIVSISDKVSEIKCTQVTAQALEQMHSRFLEVQHLQHLEVIERLHTLETRIMESVVAAKDEARSDLSSYSHEVSKKQTDHTRWIIGLCITVIVALITISMRLFA